VQTMGPFSRDAEFRRSGERVQHSSRGGQGREERAGKEECVAPCVAHPPSPPLPAEGREPERRVLC
jgi:hypothetical protein